MNVLRIGGVPEHFNLAWKRLLTAQADGGRATASWHDFPAGTGAMIDALEAGALDVALLLTEGAVAGIAGGGDYRIVSLYTQTPLIWGVHVAERSKVTSIEDLEGACYAVSRAGSGSHLMAYVLAERRGWPGAQLRFNAVGGIDGALQALSQGSADVFLWEKFMTQPFVADGRLRRIGELVAPWPAFVVCVSAGLLKRDRAPIVAAIADGLAAARRLAAAPDAAAQIAQAFGMSQADARQWLGETRWAEHVGVDPDVLQSALRLLAKVGVVDAAFAGPMTASLTTRDG